MYEAPVKTMGGYYPHLARFGPKYCKLFKVLVRVGCQPQKKFLAASNTGIIILEVFESVSSKNIVFGLKIGFLPDSYYHFWDLYAFFNENVPFTAITARFVFKPIGNLKYRLSLKTA